MNDNTSTAKNVLGEALVGCCNAPITGFYRDGFCHTGAEDVGVHVVCAVVTDAFLEFSAARGAARWAEALAAGVAPRVVLTATHEAALEHVDLADLKAHAIDLS